MMVLQMDRRLDTYSVLLKDHKMELKKDDAMETKKET